MFRIVREFFGLVAALAILAVVAPLFPTSLIFKPVSVHVDAQNVKVHRNARGPVWAQWSQEFERITSPPAALLNCYRDGRAFFYLRDRPIVLMHGCALESGVVYKLRMCWWAEIALNLHMAPACIEREFEL